MPRQRKEGGRTKKERMKKKLFGESNREHELAVVNRTQEIGTAAFSAATAGVVSMRRSSVDPRKTILVIGTEINLWHRFAAARCGAQLAKMCLAKVARADS